MAQRLKSWESPRHEGRNHKGRGGSAKQRQYMKRQKQLRKRLQAGINGSVTKSSPNSTRVGKDINRDNREREVRNEPLFFCA